MKLVKTLLLLVLLVYTGTAIAQVNHADLVKGDFKTGKDVTKKCLECHEKQANDFMASSHWTWKGDPKLLAKKTKEQIGKANLLNNFCISIEGGNWKGCTKCHAGYGWQDKAFDFKNKENIDCLMCHTKEKAYFNAKKTGVAGNINPQSIASGMLNLEKAAQNIGKPTRDNCGSCHFFGGGGDAVKHGDLDSTLAKPKPELDVHMGKLDFACQECHVTKNHKISGASTMTGVHEGRVECKTCHGDIHKDNKILSKHTNTIACQTCHIPYFAKGQATKVFWDWSTAGKEKEDIPEQHGKETYAKIKGDFKWEKNVVPTYAWYNGTINRYIKGDKIDPKKVVKISAPVGSIKDPKSKIYPFKVHAGKQPYDEEYKHLLTPNTVGGYWDHLNWQKALEDGAKAAGIPFSGKFGFVSTEQWVSINHEVVPAKSALQCNDCHMSGKRFDWKALGYKDDPIKIGVKVRK
ncbi:MAG: tetrathionate reductase family octaheme c-type cytochrome [Calditerrivibrio sp.]|nr:tetrathionate reductase family octaheme c-type cytochrome [Calditerrivibrio sp.]